MSRRRKILIVAGIVLGVAVLIPVIRHYQLRFAVANYVAELKAKGEPMDLAQVIPPSGPPGKNAAPLITNALSQIYLDTNSMIDYSPDYNPPYDMNQTIPGKEMLGWQQPVIHGPDTWPRNLTNTWEDLGAQLNERQSDLRDFRKLIENPVIDFNYDYSDSKKIIPVLAPHLEQFKIAIQWLETSEFYNLHQGNTTDACTDVRSMLAFVKSETDERFEISQLVRFAFAQISADATWDILQTTNVSDEELAQLQQDWQSLDFIAPLKNSFLFERISDLSLINDIRQSPTNLDDQVGWTASAVMDNETYFQKMGNGILTRWNNFQWRWFWSYSDEVRGWQMWQTVIDGTQMMETNNSLQSVQSFLNSNFSRVGFGYIKNNPYAIISQNAHAQLAAIRKLARVETTRNIVVMAIALKRYTIRNHHLPNTLDELAPDFLKTVPTDFMEGQPLRYRPNADGTFLLYSVGENGVDDGGNPSLEKDATGSNYSWQSPHALDWVWPQPATEEEIQAYYKKLSSQKN